MARFKDLCLDANDHQGLADCRCSALGNVRKDAFDGREPRPGELPVPIVDPSYYSNWIAGSTYSPTNEASSMIGPLPQ